VQINYLLVKFGSSMRPSSDYLHSIYRTYKKVKLVFFFMSTFQICNGLFIVFVGF